MKFKKYDRVKGLITGKIGTFLDYYTREDGTKSTRVHIVRWDDDLGRESIAVRIELYIGDPPS